MRRPGETAHKLREPSMIKGNAIGCHNPGIPESTTSREEPNAEILLLYVTKTKKN
jgi:hypothetical protein